MALVKGPFEIQVATDVLAGIDEIDFEYDVDTDSIDTIQGRSYDIPKTHKVSVTVTFVETDVPSLAVALPQYFVANGQVLSTGETVNDAQGAMDIVPGECGDTADLQDVLIIACGTNPSVLRVVDTFSEVDGFPIEDSVRKCAVKFTGSSDAATVQLFRQNAVELGS